ncbi:MAG: hypothetical protein K0S32_3424 [Bacteroidetes bacterium]|jgi:hypothetical protein|nr:hypothetical protein [Bacteroidota bacterium]
MYFAKVHRQPYLDFGEVPSGFVKGTFAKYCQMNFCQFHYKLYL